MIEIIVINNILFFLLLNNNIFHFRLQLILTCQHHDRNIQYKYIKLSNKFIKLSYTEELLHCAPIKLFSLLTLLQKTDCILNHIENKYALSRKKKDVRHIIIVMYRYTIHIPIHIYIHI